MTDTPRTGLEFVDAGTTDIDQPVNNNALALDAVVGMSVVSATTTAEPALTSPADDGKVYILPAGRTGTNWGAQAVGTIAQWYSGSWYFYTPWAGLQARAADTGIRYQYTTSWAVWATAAAQTALAGTGGTDTFLRSDGTNTSTLTGSFTVGAGTGSRSVFVNGANSGTGGGSVISAQNAGVGIVAFGNRSALHGGAYDATATIFTTGSLQFTINGSVSVVSIDSSGNIVSSATIRPATYTVATLPAAGLVAGMRATVTDATAPTFLAVLVGGGAVTCPAFYNGTNWVAG